MQVGVYNRWLFTLGGGEKHSLAIAQLLSSEHQVFVISHQQVPKEQAEARLGLDLRRVQFVFVAERPAPDIKYISDQYDFFINASYMDFFPSLAGKSVMLTYFPAPLDPKLGTSHRRRLGHLLKNWLKLPVPLEGVFHVRSAKGGLEILLGPRARMIVPCQGGQLSLRFRLRRLHPSIRKAIITLDDSESEEVVFSDNPDGVLIERIIRPKGRIEYRELAIAAVIDEETGDIRHAHCFSMEDLAINTFRFKLFRSLLFRNLPSLGTRLLHLPSSRPTIGEALASYDAIWANSRFTQKWVRRYWNRESHVLYPPVDVETFTPLPKRPWILSVGRFFAGSHNKKHMEMVEAFRQMVDEGLEGWELHLVGGSTPGQEHQRYLARIRARARGYPIHVRADVPFPELKRLYGESSIYWHAAGLAEDEEKDPARFEHFGITTVESMAAGCVPIVIARGGQPEIVHHGKDGFLWQSIPELKKQTWILTRDPALRDRMAKAAVERSRDFGWDQFAARLDYLMGILGAQ